ncbi:hypothetical protein HJD18_02035 [Thermoleophilia bacterium SCSIO 60948]|nr:hypothetical protein HJD18_02035 [Thermoleophilia bacterium SCSIO 60948]
MKLLSSLAAALLSILAVAGIAVAANPPTKVTETVNIPAGDSPGSGTKGSADPRCRGGRFAVAGGFESGVESGDFQRRANVFTSTPAGQRWRGKGIASGSQGGEIAVTAYCAKRKPASVRTRTISVPSGTARDLRIRCPRGKQVVGIGYEGEYMLKGFRGPQPTGRVTVVYGARRASAREALIRGASQSLGAPEAGRLTGYAVCSKSPRLKAVSDSVEVAPGTDGDAVARCPSGSVAMFGGFEQVLPGGDPTNVQGGVVDSVRSGDRAWRVRLINEGGGGAPSLKVRSYAYCAR